MKNTVKQSLLVVTVSLLVAVVSIAISLFAFMGTSIKEQSEANDILSIYEETDYDYIIKNPSADQITSFGENTSIKKVVPYYQLAYTFEIANEDIELTLKSIDNEQDLNFTEFSKTRLVEEQNVSGNKIYLDYNLATRCGLKIGDTIGSNAMQFVVAGFYKNYDAQLAFVPNLKNIIQSSLSCAGVYVEVENSTEFNASVVQGYKPLATLKGRESFSDDAAYQAYLNDFNSRDYSAYIIEKNVGYAEAKESYDNKIAEAKSSYMTAGIVAGIIVLVGLISLSVFFAKKIKYEVVDGARKSVLFRYVLGAIFALVGVIASWFIGVKSLIATQLHFISLINVLSLGWASLIVPIVGVTLGMIVNIFIVQGYKEKQR